MEMSKEMNEITSDNFKFSDSPTLEEIRQQHAKFASDRDWDKFDTPRNVLLALVAEVGELAEIFQWKGEVKDGLPEFSKEERQHVGEEMSDVLILLVRLAHKCHINLPPAVLEKIEHNSNKYPVDKAYGKNDKYTAYQVDK